MKKQYLLLVFLLIVSISLLTGCGGGGGDDKQDSPIVGTWYLNYDNDEPIWPSAKDQADTLVLKSDGRFEALFYDTYTDASGKTQVIDDSCEGPVNGKWAISDGIITLEFEGESLSANYNLSNSELVLYDEDEEGSWKETYRKNKYNGETQQNYLGKWYINYCDDIPVYASPNNNTMQTLTFNSDGKYSVTMYDIDVDKSDDYQIITSDSYLGTESGTYTIKNGNFTRTINGDTQTFPCTCNSDTFTYQANILGETYNYIYKRKPLYK